MNVIITGKEVRKDSWQFFIMVQIFENKTKVENGAIWV